ncbi:MAG: GNAT family N-acetyltransferase [Chloroflexota bacterium]
MENFETERLIIRPFVIDDLETAHQLLDIDIQWSGPSFSLEQRRQRIQFYIDLAGWHDVGRLYGYRAIILKASQNLIGMCGFQPGMYTPRDKALFWPQLYPNYDDPNIAIGTMELSLGYALSSQHRGQGYAAEAVGTIVRYAFQTLKLKRIFAETNRSNTGSINLMQRIGMRTASNPNRPKEDWPGGPGVVGVIDNALAVSD